jgi:pectate lyase
VVGVGGASVVGIGGAPTNGGVPNVGVGGNVGNAGGNTESGTGGIAGNGGASNGGAGNGGSVPVDGALPVPPLPELGEPIGFATENGGTTGGAGGQVVTVDNFADLKSHAESSTATVIMIEGTITNGAGGGQIRIASNKSLIGVGSTAFLSGVGLLISSANNIIVQNLRVSLGGTTTPSSVNGGDIVGIAGTSKNIWIDHCEFFSEDPNVQTDIDKYDGLIDIRDQTGFITLSWNHFHDHHKGGLVGASDTDLSADRKVTFHHNYYDNVKYRIPMYRGSVGHFFNNYIVGAENATEIREGTCVRVEKNYYEALHYSIYTPSDHPGSTERIDNIEVSRTTRAYPDNCTADIPYEYSSALTTMTQDVRTVVPQGAGVGKL